MYIKMSMLAVCMLPGFLYVFCKNPFLRFCVYIIITTHCSVAYIRGTPYIRIT